jgi:hypothetical protein
MGDLKSVLERGLRGFEPSDNAFERTLRRRNRKRRNRRIAAAVVGISVALLTLASLVRTFRTVERPADEPTPPPTPQGIFANVGGWIASSIDRVNQHRPRQGESLGIWAIDPTRPNDPEARIQLSDRPGTPLAWSSDGSKLLIERFPFQAFREPEGPSPSWNALFVLNADGTETRVVTTNPKLGGGALGWIKGGSFSPDGSQVVFATYGRDIFSQSSAEWVDGIYTVDADGGIPRLILAGRPSSTVYNPAFSPDGTQIAYLDLNVKRTLHWASLSLRVVNADGTGVRVLHETRFPPVIQRGAPAWSPDGTLLVYSRGLSLWMVRADGSGITRMPDGQSPYWSPDGSRIAFEPPRGGPQGKLAIANADGTHIQVFGYPAHSGPWNPLPSAVPGEATSTGSGLATPLVYAIAALAVVGLLFRAWRARRVTQPR